MTKIAALSPALLGSLALGAGASIINSSAMRETQRRNEAAKAQWLDYQNRNKARLETQETADRREAQTAADTNLRAQTQDSREAIIDAESSRLEGVYGAGLPDLARDTLASTQDPGRSAVFDRAMAKSLADATAEARKRIAGLARASAYGGGTQFGMGQELGATYDNAATDIGFLGDQRRGNIATLQRHQSVQPEVFEFEKPPLASLLEAGSMIVGAMDPAKLTGLFGGGTSLAPTTSIRPMPRPQTFSFMPVPPRPALRYNVTQPAPSVFVPPAYGPQ